jgi:hypothetical protein
VDQHGAVEERIAGWSHRKDARGRKAAERLWGDFFAPELHDANSLIGPAAALHSACPHARTGPDRL